MRLRLAGQQLLGDRGVVPGTGHGRGEDQRPEPGLVRLAVTVDPAVTLLDADQAPRQVVVHQMVALPVQVDPFGRHVAGEQHPYRGVPLGELLDDPLLVGVGQAAVHDPHRVPGGRPPREAQCRRYDVGQPLQRRDPLGEHHDPHLAARTGPDLAQLAQQGRQLGGVGVGHGRRQRAQPAERGPLLSVGAARRPQPRIDGLCQRVMRGQERLQQRVGEQPPLPAHRARRVRRAHCARWLPARRHLGHAVGRALGRQPDLGELGEDLLLRGRGRAA